MDFSRNSIVHYYSLFLFLNFSNIPLNALISAFSLAENSIIGDPFVNCGGNHIEVRFDTRNSFRGLVFVSGHLREPQCRSAPPEENGIGVGGSNAQIRLAFGTCGIKHTKYTDPKGVFLSTRLVVVFDPQRLSKFDRVFDLRCFYMEMEHELEKQLNVLMSPPRIQTKQISMPNCSYQIHDGSPYGPPVFYGKIGQMVYHKWTCEAAEPNQFCMIVHSCMVDDGNGDRVELIDEQGCARDKYLLQNLDYVSDLMVGKEAHVYKYADRQSMFFDCKISLSVKDPYCGECPIPQCPDPPRRKRHFPKPRHLNEGLELKIDVKGSPLNTNDNDGFIENDHPINSKNCTSEMGLLSLFSLNALMFTGAILLIRNGIKQFEN